MKKKDNVYQLSRSHNGVLLSRKTEGTTNTHNSMLGSPK
jgi:hypothetical protein